MKKFFLIPFLFLFSFSAYSKFPTANEARVESQRNACNLIEVQVRDSISSGRYRVGVVYLSEVCKEKLLKLGYKITNESDELSSVLIQWN